MQSAWLSFAATGKPTIDDTIWPLYQQDSRANVMVGALALPLLAFAFAFAEDAVSLVFTARYLEAAPVMRVYIVGLAALVVELASLTFLLQQGAFVLRLALAALAFSVSLSSLGAYAFGLAGAAADTAAAPALFESIVRTLGGLDLLIYTAGIMPPVGRTEYDTAKDLEILQVNFGGLVAWGNQAAQLFRTQRAGAIVGVSSISGNRGRKGNPLYGASKAAMDNWLESLRNRLAGEGVHVCTIKPGYIATRMTEGMSGLFWVVSADDAAAAVLAAARSGANVRYVLRRWQIVGLALGFIPSFIFRRLNF
jgi:NAD(P)-dependent dehydrogenase (short-subunit alcohol dehydrogenase family)